MRRLDIGRPGLVRAAVLILAGIAALLVGSAHHGRSLAGSPDPVVPVDRGARDPGDIRANNSPSLAQNPRRPENLAVVDRVDTPDYSCALQVSQDRGARWTRVRVPVPPGSGRTCYAPDVTFAADGTLLMSFVTLSGTANEPRAVWVTRSADGGRTLSPPRQVGGRLAFQVRLAADPARPGRVYVTWLQPSEVGLFLFGGASRVQVVRSDDGGRSWSTPASASDPRRERLLAPSPAVGPGGVLYVLYLDVGGDRLDYEAGHGGSGGPPYAGRFSLVLARSTDGGRSWRQSVVDDRIVPTRRFLAFLPPFPSVAVDQSTGRVYVAFEDGRRRPSDVSLWTLGPGARAWSGPRRVNDTAPGDGTSQYLPSVAVAPGGRLDVAYYDRRADPRNRRNEVSVQSSFDAGRTFTPHVTLTDQSFDAGIGAGSERGLPDLGSRLGLVADASAALAVWTDTRAGTVESNKQDIAFARAPLVRRPTLAGPTRTVLRLGGIALLLAGIGAVLGAVRARRA